MLAGQIHHYGNSGEHSSAPRSATSAGDASRVKLPRTACRPRHRRDDRYRIHHIRVHPEHTERGGHSADDDRAGPCRCDRCTYHRPSGYRLAYGSSPAGRFNTADRAVACAEGTPGPSNRCVSGSRTIGTLVRSVRKRARPGPLCSTGSFPLAFQGHQLADELMAKRSKASRRSLINTGRDTRFVRRGKSGRFKESDDVGRSLKADRRKKAKRKIRSGYGDKGDR